MLNFFKRILGLIEEEYEDIVGGFLKAEAKLADLAQRKRDEARDLFDAATLARMNGEAKTVQADQAEATATNIRNLMKAV